MGLFSSKLVDHDTAEWQLENFESLIRDLSLGLKMPKFAFHLPTNETFSDSANPHKKYEGHALAAFILQRVKEQCDMGGVVLTLSPTTENKPEFMSDSVVLQPTENNAAAGRYYLRADGRGNTKEGITYDRDLLNNPAQLVATFAHEMAHCIYNRMRKLPEFEEEILYEMYTDLTAVFLGYGVFLANGKSSFSSDNRGWSSQSVGYLSEAELVFATAIFMQIKDISIDVPKRYLKPHLHKMLRKFLMNGNQVAKM